MANIVKWGELGAEAIAATESAIQSGGQFLKFKVGKTHLRILPPPLGPTMHTASRPWSDRFTSSSAGVPP